MLVKINPINPQERQILKVAECLKRGGIIAYPTDTFYGIGCDIMNKRAIEKVIKVATSRQLMAFKKLLIFVSCMVSPLFLRLIITLFTQVFNFK